MSIDINWETLTSGSQGEDLAHTVRDFIHDRFQQVQLPRFIRSVEIHSFSFGSECPSIDIVDITDPHPAFYEDDSSDSSSSQEDAHSEELTSPRRAPNHQLPPLQPPHARATHFPNLQPQLQSGQTSPLRSGTPGIPGGTSNLSYFHLPLRQGLGSGTATPTPFTPTFPWPHNATSEQPYHHHNRPPTPPPPQTPWADPVSPPRTTSRPQVKSPDPDAQVDGYFNSRNPKKTQGRSEENGNTPNPLDLQLTLHISYSGSLSLSLTAEILLDYPMPSFVCLPLRLTVTNVEFDGVGLLAYLNPTPNPNPSPAKDARDGGRNEVDEGDESGRRVIFSFLPPEEGRLTLASTSTATTATSSLNSDDAPSTNQVRERKSGGSGLGALINAIHVESEIGKQGGEQGGAGGAGGAEQKQPPLKNVGKVERFVVEQVRRIFEGELVWPGWWTFLV
ncbi:uncharacterized protein KY384_001699 [Bacidia gigantensis]|uniref:uncharacterized protein n=1 Tax=Bacidia gigantensis TaxID=2732470 RepID=UPI001D04CC3B|nr:uncharacterized protein KY384_001699 [Bacidia gigantensis]KAG8533957.1 hypothetical protein KY384_001699 [Bacidia gigantensis]